MDIHAVLQAGGEGRRLSPLTDTTPKPLLEVGGMPMVERLVRQLASHGIRRITVITNWLGEIIETHIATLAGLPPDMRISFVREPRALGNIGGLNQLGAQTSPVLLAFGDLVTALDFSKLIDIHRDRGGDITLASHYETHRLQLGEVIASGDKVVGYREKPEKQFLICSGIAVINPPVLGLIKPGIPTGISELVSMAIENGFSVSHWRHGAFWMDINSPEALQHANELLASGAIKLEAE